ncbi:uncharacterized protein [Rutidosis leptorrhynchoides]|uniref:uncharacterized protein n=1 Tax=Rutidosis leptorrhynchoides TaxID=125765 RepID=UPI003A9958E3
MEKLIYALVHTARRLRRYFQAHPIQVFTDQLIKHVLARPEIYGRMVKWAIELGEHEITFLPRHSVKGQVVVDFLVELPSDMVKQGETRVTRRDTDEFWELYTEEHRLTAYVDSQLVASQLNGSFEARDISMQKYLELTKTLTRNFVAFEIKQIPRNRNKKADALSNLSSLIYDHFTIKVMVEVLERKSTDEDTVMATITTEEECWMTPFIKCLVEGTLLEDKLQARRIRMRAPMYYFKDGILYRKSFTEPYLRCVRQTQAKEIIK